MRRTKNEWRASTPQISIPFICWEADLGDFASKCNPGISRKIIEKVVGKNYSELTEIPVELLASILAVRLQAADSEKVFHWLLSTLENHFDGRFSYPFIDEHLGEICARHAQYILARMIQAASKAGNDEDFSSSIDRLLEQALDAMKHIRPRAATHEILLEAQLRGIPAKRYSMVPSYRLGDGCKQRHLWNTFTDATSHIATIVSTHKQVAIRVLADHGFPVPRHFQASDTNQALKAAQAIGYPVVVKPTSSDYGTGVSVGIDNDQDLIKACGLARKHGNVLVEQMIPGLDHRMHVIDGKCSYVVKRVPAQVVGNGVDTVSALVRNYAEDRASHHFYRRFKAASLDDPLVMEVLNKQGVTPGHVPRDGETIFLRSNSNVSTGGSFFDVTQDAHPDNILLAERAARCIGLDNAGVDFITPDISRSWRDAGGGICEVNPTPMVALENAQFELLDYLFPDGGNGRIPIVLIIGSRDDAQSALEQVRAHVSANSIPAGYIVDGRAFHGSTEITADKRTVKLLLSQLLADSSLRCVVAQVDPTELESDGLDTSYCDLAIFLTDQGITQKLIVSPYSVVGKAKRTLKNPMVEDVQRELEQEVFWI